MFGEKNKDEGSNIQKLRKNIEQFQKMQEQITKKKKGKLNPYSYDIPYKEIQREKRLRQKAQKEEQERKKGKSKKKNKRLSDK